MDDEQYYYAYYEPSPEEVRRQAQASATFISRLFKLLFLAFTLFVLFIPGFFCAYLVLHVFGRLLGNPAGWDYFWWLVGIVYVVECMIFLLKGWYMSLKEKGYILWKFLWAICFLYCFALPALLLVSLISEPFTTKSGHGMSPAITILSVASAAILAWLIYKRYQLNSDSAPKMMRWAYKLGRLIPRDE